MAVKHRVKQYKLTYNDAMYVSFSQNKKNEWLFVLYICYKAMCVAAFLSNRISPSCVAREKCAPWPFSDRMATRLFR